MFKSRMKTVGKPLLNSYKIRGSTPVIVKTTLIRIRKVEKKRKRRQKFLKMNNYMSDAN